MPPEIKDYPLTPFREALTSVTGALISATLVSMVAGAIQLFVYDIRDTPSMSFILLALAWFGHWIAAGLAIWGFLFLPIHFVCLHRLIHGLSDPFVLLGVLFCNQILVSTLTLCMFCREWEERRTLLISGAVAIGLGALYAWRVYRRGRFL
ncbi:MAG: hypothetical protein B9S32_12205 [Verrucomicrobia bacterium Tous-C9LFEB]|nr:MAG: hypothetical protein B9S32_12205 [Verrucomicrobia bacterium Tous-C9LFEB]